MLCASCAGAPQGACIHCMCLCMAMSIPSRMACRPLLQDCKPPRCHPVPSPPDPVCCISRTSETSQSPRGPGGDLRRSLTGANAVNAADPGPWGPTSPRPGNKRGTFGARHDSDTELMPPVQAGKGDKGSRRSSLTGEPASCPCVADAMMYFQHLAAMNAAVVNTLQSSLAYPASVAWICVTS